MNKLVALLRVKDGILFIDEWLQRMEQLVDEIVVVDNGSTDGTLEKLMSHTKVVLVEQTKGFDEGRDKILLYKMARKRKPNWCIWLDVDEIFEFRLNREKLEKMMENKKTTRYYFRRFHMHKDAFHFEAELKKLWSISIHDRILWKEQETGYFENIKLHNGLIRGIHGTKKITKYRIRHLGAVNSEYLKRKTEQYLKEDDNEKRKKMYIKNRDQLVKTWKWYEYKENPLLVILINTILNCLMIVHISINKIVKFVK